MRKWKLKNLEKISIKQKKYHKKYYKKYSDAILRKQKGKIIDMKLNNPEKYKVLKEDWARSAKRNYLKNREEILQQQKERMRDMKINNPEKYKQLLEKMKNRYKNKSTK